MRRRRLVYSAFVSGLVRRRTIVLEWFVACLASGYGLWLALLMLLALRYGRRGMLVLPFLLLALALAASGAIGIGALAVGRAGESRSKKNLDLCRRSMFAAAFLWALLTIAFGLWRPLGLGWPLFAGNGMAALWCYLRLYLRFKED